MSPSTTALGWIVRAIGKALDTLPFVSGGPIIRAGQSMLDAAEKTRKELEGLSWQDALDKVGDRAEKVAEQLSNVPEGFRVFNAALARYASTAAPARATATSSMPVLARGGTVYNDHRTINAPVTIQEAATPRATGDAVLQGIRRQLGGRGDADSLWLRNTLPERL